MEGEFDKSFNEAAYNGAKRFKKETGIEYLEFEVTQEAQREQAMQQMARRGANIIVVLGFQNGTPLKKVAAEYPNSKCTIIDAVVDLPNFQSVIFKEYEGSFLVGMAAAIASKTGKVGFVGGMDIPLIRNFAFGYEQGIMYVNPKAELFINMTGTTPAARNARQRARSSPSASSIVVPMSYMPPPVVQASASSRPPRTRANSRSASTATRTISTPATI